MVLVEKGEALKNLFVQFDLKWGRLIHFRVKFSYPEPFSENFRMY